ncbi:MAG: hypothetical protein ACHQ49_16115 [Elusimicrobiota bacterium]
MGPRRAAAAIILLAAGLAFGASDEERALREWTVNSPSIAAKSRWRDAAIAMTGLAAAAFVLWRRRKIRQ